MEKKLFLKNIEEMFESLEKGRAILATVDDETGPTGMTIAWGFFGNMWNEYTFICAVRPNRYTYRGIKTTGKFTVNFFDENHSQALAYFGTVSGYDENKFEKGYITAEKENDGFTAAIKEARMVIECEVVTANQIEPFILKNEYTQQHYKNDNGFHTMIYGKVINIAVR